MLQVLSPQLMSLGTLANLIKADVAKNDSGSWRISATAIQEGVANHIRRENYVSHEGQFFTIRETTLTRDGEKRLVSFTAEHIIHELEEHVITEEYTLTGTLGEHIQELLTHQNAGFAYVAGSGQMFTIVRSLTITRGTLAENLRLILSAFNARLAFHNLDIKPIPRRSTTSSGATLEYSVTNKSISRTYSRDSVITRLVVKAQVPNPEESDKALDLIKTYGGDGGYRAGIERFMDFGEMGSEEDVDWLAGEYLDVYASPDASYEVEFAELKRLGEPGFEIDTGMTVRVLDAGLGIDAHLPVVSYHYSLVDDAETSKVTLGNFRTMTPLYDESPKAIGRMVVAENTVLAWAETVMNYVNKVLGGTIRDIDPELLVYTNPKQIRPAAVRLASITPDYDGQKYNASMTLKDPLAEIKRKRYQMLGQARSEIYSYIASTVGAPGISNVVTLINQAYSAAYGPGQTINLPPDTVESVFGEDFAPGSQEMQYAENVLNDLASRIGNLSEAYLEVGGGNGGAIGTINSLHRMLRSHGMTVAETDPDDTVGKDGDLWFKFEEEEEE